MEFHINDSAALCQQYLRVIYRDAHIQTPNQMGQVVQTYGEIYFPSMNKLLSIVPLVADDVFLDFGSGMGKVVLQVFLQTPVHAAWGVEIVPELYQQAVLAAQMLQNDLPDFYARGRKLTFVLGNFLEIPLPPATVIFLCSACFSPAMLLTLGKIINCMPSIHTVLTLRPLLNLSHLVFKRAVEVECSWDSALCYVYGR